MRGPTESSHEFKQNHLDLDLMCVKYRDWPCWCVCARVFVSGILVAFRGLPEANVQLFNAIGSPFLQVPQAVDAEY